MTRITPITPILMLILCASALAKEPATTQSLSNTRYGLRTLSVQSNAYAPDISELMTFLNKRAGELGPTLLNIPADKMEPPIFGITIGGGSGKGVEMEMEFSSANFPDSRPAAKEFLNAMVESAVNLVRDDFNNRRDKELMMAKRDESVAAQQLDQATMEAKELRAKLRDLAGRADVSTQGITAAVSRLEEEKEKLELDLLGKKARREALEKEIAEQAATLQKQTDSDPVARELKTIVEVRTAKLDNLKKLVDSGQASQGELNDAIASVAEARAKLAERQRGGGAIAGGGETLEALNRERVNLSVDLRELEARLEFVSKRLPSLRATMDKLDELQRAEGNLNSARATLESSTNRFRDVQRRLETADSPQVLVKTARDSATLPGPSAR